MKNKNGYKKKHFVLLSILVLLLPTYIKNSWWNFNDTTRTTTPTTDTSTSRTTTPTTETSTYRTTTPTTDTSTSRTTTPTTETSTSRTTTPTTERISPAREETSTREDYSEPEETPTREDYSEPEETPTAREDYPDPDETPIRKDYSPYEEPTSRTSSPATEEPTPRTNYSTSVKPTTRKSYSSRTEEPPRKNPTLRYITPEKRPVQEIQKEFTAITETRLNKKTEFPPTYNRDNDRINITRNTKILVVPDLTTAEEETRNLLRKNASLDENLIISPSSDTDGDGVSDTIEDQYFTDFTNPDSDGDGISDGVEILAYNSDPLEVEKLDTTPSINNLNGRTTGSLPLIKGRAKPNEKITITATQDQKNIITVCKTESDEQGIFICQPDQELKNGNYSLFANSKREVQIKVEDEKNKQKIEVEVKKVPKTLTVLKNTQQFLNIFSNIIGTEMSEANFRSPVEKFFSSQAEVQKLIGKSEPNTSIMITWQSFTLNSVVLADASQGKFEAMIPRKLAKGYHKILVYAYNAKLNSINNPKLINFFVE